MTGYAENVLGGYYRRKNGGEWHGGAMYYIRYGLAERKRTSRAAKPLAAVFAGACVLASFGMGNIVQMNSAALALESGFGVPAWIAGLALTVCAGAVIFGGMKRTAKVSEKLVPLMSGLYIIGGGRGQRLHGEAGGRHGDTPRGVFERSGTWFVAVGACLIGGNRAVHSWHVEHS